MQSRHLTTDSVGPRDAFAFWQDVICDTFIRLDCISQKRAGFQGNIRSRPLGALQLSSMASDQIHLTRSQGRIAMAREEYCLVVVQGRGRTLAEQNGRQVVLEAGDIALFDSVRPYAADLKAGFHHFVLKIPRDALGCRIGPVERISALKIPGDHGIGSVTSRFIRMLPSQIGVLEETEASRLSETCLDLLATAFASVAPVTTESGSSPRLMHTIRAKTYMASHLHEELTPSSIAEALGISVRYLNSLFAGEDLSVGRLIWKLRLERCKQALSDPQQRHRSISEIAFSWGFSDSSHFSRMFREETGVSPRQFRKTTSDSLTGPIGDRR